MLSLRSLAFILASAIRRARALSCAAPRRSPDRISGRKMATEIATKIATKMAVAAMSVSTKSIHLLDSDGHPGDQHRFRTLPEPPASACIGLDRLE